MRTLRLAGSIFALSLGGAAAHGQTPYPSPAPSPPSPYGAVITVQPLSDADLLASELRLLAADPHNVQALVRAGELALKLDDDTAAAAFFARADRIDPRNARVKAGEGSLLVTAERPGDALRHFAEAETLGGDPRSFAADRGLAYDLVGEQERAQRDYRLALKAGPNDETQRRYALSLGISGKRELALAQIDPLLRRSDRGAWRTRAFILAMGGDKAGAAKIATSMMPTGMAGGLQPFFEILPTLRPADRAFAVHFGEVRATAERLADARLVPPLAALGPDPTAPVVAAAAPRPLVVVDAREERRLAKAARKTRRSGGREQIAALTTPPPQPLPAPPAYSGQPVAPAPVVLASNPVRVPPVAASAPMPSAPVATFVERGAPVASAEAAAKPSVIGNVPSGARPTPEIAVQPIIVPKAATVPPGPAVTAVPVSAPAAVPAPPAPTFAASPPSPTPVRSEESILAAIIADITVPGTEQAAAPAPDEPPVQPLAKRVAAKAALTEKPPVDQAALDKKAADKKVANKKVVADKKAASDKKAAEAKKLADAKKAAEEKKKKDPKFLEPSRVWVQVSGGANEKDLPKQWTKVRAKSKAFGGKGGWTTPLRATNRILTGPFKSDDEAQSFVNTIAKDGVSGFVFVSDAGQKITKLAGK
ncbi:SPOR domain-containing protein [Sphingomonas sp.]|uniref:SPOR domain-containing protein n=1 Tax=Sphingomonas sp. TaxID=28214 RepID=UPI00334176BD